MTSSTSDLQPLHQDLSPPVSDLNRIIQRHDKTVDLVERGLKLLEDAVRTCPGLFGIEAALGLIGFLRAQGGVDQFEISPDLIGQARPVHLPPVSFQLLRPGFERLAAGQDTHRYGGHGMAVGLG